MYTIHSIRSTRTFACPGEYAYDAEATITLDEHNGDKELFVRVNWAMGFMGYYVTDVSDFDYMVGEEEEAPDGEKVEFFESLEDAQDSEYIDLYRMLDKILYDMYHGPSKGLTKKAVMGESKIEDEVIDEDYHFALIQEFTYDHAAYKATYTIDTGLNVTMSLAKNGVLCEQYEDLELASYSEWFMLYCKMKKKLLKHIGEYKIKNEQFSDICDEILDDGSDDEEFDEEDDREFNLPDIDTELLKKQTPRMSVVEVNHIKERLSETFIVEESIKDYNCLGLTYNGVKIGNYWCKQRYIRLVISKRLFPTLQFDYDLAKRTALYDRKKTGVWAPEGYEFVLTQEEADMVLGDVVEQI